ncbi:hypothetical protein F4778DRAFT_720503 [Xylariomycetidae sp. FL2044]|nr:hypothetical protein F4778DRAFT_720503 [Xylariomycetidae sp. FL2044]
MDKPEMHSKSYNTFHLFQNLPPELRNKIWHLALPWDLKPALYAYKKGCWRERYLRPDEVEFDSTNMDLNLNFEYRHDLLDRAQIYLPMAHVNKEAHGIVVDWAEREESPISLAYEKERGRLVFLRSFMTDRDAVFVRCSEWDDVLRDVWDEIFVPDRMDRPITPCAGTRRIALPTSLIASHHSQLSDLFESNFHSLRALDIVEISSIQVSESGHRELWEVTSSRRVAWWTLDDGWELSLPDGSGHLVELASQGLTTAVSSWHVREFEIFLSSCSLNS